MTELGRLEEVGLREVWASEDGDFTPWLAEQDNLRLLGETIGIELELETQEQSVGRFRADILCKDLADESWVLIENQLERTDHTHLGQLMTYAAGLQAVSIIWISRRMTDEHRAALDWLNGITDEKFRFFGLEVELWKIGDSSYAPKFNVVSQPNDWSRGVSRDAAQLARSGLTSGKQLQLDFWTGFADHILAADFPHQLSNPQPQQFLNLSIGRGGFHLAAIASLWNPVDLNWSHDLRTELVIDGVNAKAHFDGLITLRSDIDGQLGDEVVWHSPEDARTCRIYKRKSVDLNSRERWDEYFEWLVEQLNLFHAVFRPFVRTLEP